MDRLICVSIIGKLIRLDRCQLKQSLRNLGLLKRLMAVERILHVIPQRWALFVDVAKRFEFGSWTACNCEGATYQ